MTTNTFQLDTSGFVPTPDGTGGPNNCGRRDWSDLSPFTQGYIEALFAEHGEALTHEAWLNQTHIDIEHLGGRARAFSDLAPETLARIIADCERGEARIGDGAEWGRYFWAARQGGLYGGDPTAKAPPLTVTLGDDGKVRFA